MSQLARALRLVRHLRRRREATFTELLAALAPISRTTLAKLLHELVALGEIVHDGRAYRSRSGAFSGGELSLPTVPAAARPRVDAILARTAAGTGHSCALFAHVGESTMKIVARHNQPEPAWGFSPVGNEWPLVPFHGFAKVFLAHADAALTEACHRRWVAYLKPELVPPTGKAFAQQLASVRKRGFALEYREELPVLLRLAVPVRVAGHDGVRFCVGLAARSVYLVEFKRLLPAVRHAAADLGPALAAVG